MTTPLGLERLLAETASFDAGLRVDPDDAASLEPSGLAGALVRIETAGDPDPFESALARMSAWGRRFDERPALVRPMRRADELGPRQRPPAILLALGDPGPLADRLERIDLFHGLGIRALTLTTDHRSLTGDGCLERSDGGLSRFGVRAIERMNELGLLIDLGRTGRRSTLEAIETSSAPVACLGSGSWTFCDDPRNKTDEELDLLADRGGLLALPARPERIRRTAEPSLSDLVDHLEHAIGRIGPTSVALALDRPLAADDETGPDRDGPTACAGVETAAAWPSLAAALLDRGLSETDVGLVLGGNVQRVLSAVLS